MSRKKCNSQVRLKPEQAQKLKEISDKITYNPSLTKLVELALGYALKNGTVEQWEQSK